MRKTKEEAEQTRQKILNAARKMFFQNGVAKTSLEHIAKEAGVTRGAIYWHFKDKTALFFALQQSACVPIDEGIQKFLKIRNTKIRWMPLKRLCNSFFPLFKRAKAPRKCFPLWR